MRKTCPFRSVFGPLPTRAGLLLLAWLMVFPPLSSAQEPDPDVSYLNFSNWRAVAYSHQAGGTLCWLTGPDGSLRLEARRGPADFRASDDPADGSWPTGLDPLLNRAGEGWTVVLGPDDTGTLNAWGREWQPPPVGLVQMIRLVTQAVENHPASPGALPFGSVLKPSRNRGAIPRPIWVDNREGETGPTEKIRYELAPLDLTDTADQPKVGFRARMAARGRGTGGVGEIVTLSWLEVPESPGSQVEIMSSRRPGTLILETPDKRRVETPPPELFLPLWPLSQFF